MKHDEITPEQQEVLAEQVAQMVKGCLKSIKDYLEKNHIEDVLVPTLCGSTYANLLRMHCEAVHVNSDKKHSLEILDQIYNHIKEILLDYDVQVQVTC